MSLFVPFLRYISENGRFDNLTETSLQTFRRQFSRLRVNRINEEICLTIIF